MNTSIVLLGILLLAGFAAFVATMMAASDRKARRKRMKDHPDWVYDNSTHRKRMLKDLEN